MTITCKSPRSITIVGLYFACVWLATSIPIPAAEFTEDGASKKDVAPRLEKGKADNAGEKAAAPDREQKKDDAKKPVRNPLTDLIKRGLTGKASPSDPAGTSPPGAGDAPS